MARQRSRTRKVKRFTVTLEAPDYERLLDLARTHDPPLSLRYVVEYAIKQFLRRSADHQLTLDFGVRDGHEDDDAR